MPHERSWTIYIAQDKHLDYDWCGSESEIETRMAALVDGYLDLVETAGRRWNLDCALWLEVYRRQRGEAGAARLLDAIRRGSVGYAAQHSVMLWGLMGPELAVRALAAGREIEEATGRPAHTALIMENAGMPWGLAQVLADCGVRYVARGIYDLRGESYARERAPHPLFWWLAPDGSRLLTHWPPYTGTRTWGGYAEAGELLRLAGEGWDAFHLQRAGDRNTPEVYAARVAYVAATVARYEALGDGYPVSSILLLGTGWDNWTVTEDVSRFIERYNAEQHGRVRLVDARYDEFFAAVEREVGEGSLTLPEVRGSYGICWEEWAAHLAGYHAEFRRAERLVPRIEARRALAATFPPKAQEDATSPLEPGLLADADAALEVAYRGLLRYTEHDMGGCNLAMAAISAGNRAAATARALTVAHTLASADLASAQPDGDAEATSSWQAAGVAPHDTHAALELPWRGGLVVLDSRRGAVAALRDADGVDWVPPEALSGDAVGLGEMVRARYRGPGPFRDVLPEALPRDPHARVDVVLRREGPEGLEVQVQGRRWGTDYLVTWCFHRHDPVITLRYDLWGGWDAAPQSLQVAFPLALGAGSGDDVRYHHDAVGAIVAVGRAEEGGDELPGSNPVLRALHTFAAAHEGSPQGEPDAAPRGAVLLSPDAHLVAFGPAAAPAVGPITAGITSIPMMNLTRNDRQVMQGGRQRWTFRYRLVLERGAFDPLRALSHAQRFGEAHFPWLSGAGPSVAHIEGLEIDYAGGPLLSCRANPQGDLMLRFWNVLDRPTEGSFRLPETHRAATRCDAQGRRLAPLAVEGGRVRFTARPRGLATIMLEPSAR